MSVFSNQEGRRTYSGEALSACVYFAGWYGSGKTTFLLRFVENVFQVNGYTPCEHDSTSVTGTVNGVKVQLNLREWFVQMWDAAHQLVSLGWDGIGNRSRVDFFFF